jgi:hypothetical protein
MSGPLELPSQTDTNSSVRGVDGVGGVGGPVLDTVTATESSASRDRVGVCMCVLCLYRWKIVSAPHSTMCVQEWIAVNKRSAVALLTLV